MKAREYGLARRVSTDHGRPQPSEFNLENAYPELLQAGELVPEVLLNCGMEFDTPGANHSSLIIPKVAGDDSMRNFQKQGFEVRVAWNFRSEFLGGLGDIPVEDAYVDDRTTVDINTSNKMNEMPGQPELMLNVENVTNLPEVYYAGQEDHLAYYYLSGRTVSLGYSMGF